MSQSPGGGFASISRVTGLKSAVCVSKGVACMLLSAAANKEALTIIASLDIFVLAPHGRASHRGLKSSPKANTPGKPSASAKPPQQRARPADNTRTLTMHKAFRIGVAAYALAGFGESASAQDQVEAGGQLYEEHCMGCHGEKLKAPGTSLDLRKLTAEQRSRFDKFVLDGKGQMPPWRGTLNQAELDQLWAYI